MIKKSNNFGYGLICGASIAFLISLAVTSSLSQNILNEKLPLTNSEFNSQGNDLYTFHLKAGPAYSIENEVVMKIHGKVNYGGFFDGDSYMVEESLPIIQSCQFYFQINYENKLTFLVDTSNKEEFQSKSNCIQQYTVMIDKIIASKVNHLIDIYKQA